MGRRKRLDLTGGVWKEVGFALKKTWVEVGMFLTGPLPDTNTSPYPVSILPGTAGQSSVQA